MTVTSLKRERFAAFEALAFEPSPGVNVRGARRRTMKLHIVVHQADEGGYWAEVDLPRSGGRWRAGAGVVMGERRQG